LETRQREGCQAERVELGSNPSILFLDEPVVTQILEAGLRIRDITLTPFFRKTGIMGEEKVGKALWIAKLR
jgi:F0F1-type ATP synthase beta subunit